MLELTTNNAIIFGGGMLAGMFIVFLWSKLRPNTVNSKSNEIEYDHTRASNFGDIKLVIVVRKDLKMGHGKVAAQCCHAAVLAHEIARKEAPDICSDWERNGQPKIILKIDNEEGMLKLAEKAENLGLLVIIVKDAGKTQVAPYSRTVMAIGPDSERQINEVTGYLSLY